MNSNSIRFRRSFLLIRVQKIKSGDVQMQANIGAEAIPSITPLTGSLPPYNVASSSADFGNEGSAGSATSYKLVTASGNPLIDGVLSGVAWKTNNLTFAYPTAGSDYGQNYGRG